MRVNVLSATRHQMAACAQLAGQATGLIYGRLVLTQGGEMPPEILSVGDKIITRDSGLAVLRQIQVSELTVAPIRIRAGSLGHTRPERDMLVAPDSLIHIRDWRAQALLGKPSGLIAARELVDDEFITQERPQRLTLCDLVFDRQHILYVDGVEMASAEV